MKKPSFFTLLLMISFASVNAVLFTPALPTITSFFSITEDLAQQTITWFLVGYTIGQLLYGPLANRFGRKPALYIGISLQIISSFLCVLAGWIHWFPLLVLGRFLLALGSGVGLKITFTMVNECYEAKVASQKIAYLILAFAVTPALGVALGGILNTHFGWTSCFYAGIAYGVLLLALVRDLPETMTNLDYQALKFDHLIKGYSQQFKNPSLLAGGFLMGCTSSFVYVFAALAPFVAMNLLGMNSEEYGLANLMPALGMISGALLSAQLVKKFELRQVIKYGLLIAALGIGFMFTALGRHLPPIYSLFAPMALIYFGLSLVLANASSVALSHTQDKAHGSAVMNFVNMGCATIVVLCLGWFETTSLLLPCIYLSLCVLMLGIFRFI